MEPIYDIGGRAPWAAAASKAVQTAGPPAAAFPWNMLGHARGLRSLAQIGSIMASGRMGWMMKTTQVDVARTHRVHPLGPAASAVPCGWA